MSGRGRVHRSQQWAWCVAGLPDEVIREEPAAAIVTSFLRGGILLDLAGLEELEGFGDIHEQIAEAFVRCIASQGRCRGDGRRRPGQGEVSDEAKDDEDNVDSSERGSRRSCTSF